MSERTSSSYLIRFIKQFLEDKFSEVRGYEPRRFAAHGRDTEIVPAPSARFRVPLATIIARNRYEPLRLATPAREEKSDRPVLRWRLEPLDELVWAPTDIRNPAAQDRGKAKAPLIRGTSQGDLRR